MERNLNACDFELEMSEFLRDDHHVINLDSTIHNLRTSYVFPALPFLIHNNRFPSHQIRGRMKGLSVTNEYLFHRINLPKTLTGFVTSRWIPRTTCGKPTHSGETLHIGTTCFINEIENVAEYITIELHIVCQIPVFS